MATYTEEGVVWTGGEGGGVGGGGPEVPIEMC